MKEYRRYSRKITSTTRWKYLRLQILERDGYACVRCGSLRRLEVDHIKPVRTAPHRGFDPRNLQTLCCRCHTAKTRTEIKIPQLSPKRRAWADLVKGMTNA